MRVFDGLEDLVRMGFGAGVKPCEVKRQYAFFLTEFMDEREEPPAGSSGSVVRVYYGRAAEYAEGKTRVWLADYKESKVRGLS